MSGGASPSPEPFAPSDLDAAAPLAAAERVLNVQYRSGGALLMAYAWRMARGELFLETSQPFKVGTRLMLRLHAPQAAAPFQIEGIVGWIRAEATGPGLPAGMGIALRSSIETQGAIIDGLAAAFRSIRVLVMGDDPKMRAQVSRYVRSLLTCDILEAELTLDARAIGMLVGTGVDLVFVDLDHSGTRGVSALKLLGRASTAVTAPASGVVPVIALAQQEGLRADAAAAGAVEVLGTPPLFSEMRNSILHALSAPAGWNAQ